MSGWFTLTRDQRELIITEGTARNAVHAKVKDVPWNKEEGKLENHILGRAGERVIAWTLGIEADKTNPTGPGDPVKDLRYRGKSIQVKTNRHHDGDFYMKASLGGLLADIGALVIGDITDWRFRVAGWIEKHRYHEEKISKVLVKNGNTVWLIPQASLHPIKDLMIPFSNCYSCYGRDYWWSDIGMKWICSNCHPSPV